MKGRKSIAVLLGVICTGLIAMQAAVSNADIEIGISSNELTLTWRSTSGITYRVMSDDTLLENPSWTNASGDIVATNISSSWSTNLPAADTYYYRVLVKVDTNLYVNAYDDVGYSIEEVDPGGYIMVANQFVGTNETGSTISDAFGDSLPDGTEILAHTGSGFNVYTYFGSWYDDMFTDASNVLIDRGDGVWVHNTSGQTIDVIMSGKLSTSGATTNALSADYNMVAYPYPTKMEFDRIPSPLNGDEVYIWTGYGYNIHTYWGSWNEPWDFPPPPPVPVGRAFFYRTSTSRDWIMTKPY